MLFQKQILIAADTSDSTLVEPSSAAPEQKKVHEQGLYSASDLQNWRWRKIGRPKINPPETVIVCLLPDLLQYARRRYPVKAVNGFFGDLFLVKKWGDRVALAGGIGLGAPAMAALVEEYTAFGVQRFLSIGTAGGLQPGLSAGDVVVCQHALCGDGTSSHYLPAAEIVAADSQILANLISAFTRQGVPFTGGVAWTTDTPYRETRQDVERQRAAGTLAVDMEAAALFAAAQGLGVQAGAVLVIADRLLPGAWEPPEEMEPVYLSLRAVLDASLTRLEGS